MECNSLKRGRAAKARDELSIFNSRLQLDPESSELASLDFK